MRSVLRSETAAGEFEGASAEEALARAYAVLGVEAPVRCWKVRRGGVLGFFVRETFVAALHDPTGADITGATIPGDENFEHGHPDATAVREAPSTAHAQGLAPLVAATDDCVTIGDATLDTPSFVDHAFREVLAQAQAALDGGESQGLDSPHPTQDLGENPGASEPSGEIIDSLDARLSLLGVPDEFRPADLTSLDALVHSLARLPSAAPLPRAGGSLVVVVVGSRRDAAATAQRLALTLGITPTDVIVGERSVTQLRRIARRRSTPRVTVVSFEAPLSTSHLDETAAWLDRLAPDYVLGAVSASAKRADVERWVAQLGRVDALALERLRSTVSVADLMGVAPIALLEGAPATALRWLHVLLTRLVEEAS